MLSEIKDIQKFEKYLNKYETEETGYSIKYFSLEKWFDVVSKEEGDDNRAFFALIDIKLSLSHVFRDMQSVRKVCNENFSKGKLEGDNFLDSYPIFLGKIELHRAIASFVLKYRAMWDKIMGFLILIIVPDAYEKYMTARSRKKRFKDIFSKLESETSEFAEEIHTKITTFDNKYRTAEAHGTGMVRKYAFEMGLLKDSPLADIVDYWNFLNETVHKISKVLESKYLSANKTMEPNETAEKNGKNH